MKNLQHLIYALFFSFAILCFCSKPQETAKKGTSMLPPIAKSTKVIGLCIAGSDACYNAASAVFESHSKEMGWNVIRSYSDYKSEKEISNIQEFIAKKVDAIAIITTDIKAGGEAAKMCNEAAIPIFFLMTMPDLSNGAKAAAIVTIDWYMTGFVNAEYIAKKYVKAKCVLIEGGYDQGMTELMRKGFEDGLKSVKTSRAKVVANFSGGWMKPNAMAVMEDLLKTNIDFDCIFTGNEEMLSGVVEVLKSKNILNKYHLFSENGREDVGIKLLKEGIIEATANAPTTADGEIAFQLMKAYFEKKTIPYHVNNSVTLLTKDNSDPPIPWDPETFLSLSKQNINPLDYTKLEVLEKEREWSITGNNYKGVEFYK
jgi:ribose transport system substrate-binding protein